ncbi:MAG: hypothetical protein RIA71_11390 [Oceanicaulis sp.]
MSEEMWAELELTTAAAGMLILSQRSSNGQVRSTPIDQDQVEQVLRLAQGEAAQVSRETPEGVDRLDIRFSDCVSDGERTLSVYQIAGSQSGERIIHVDNATGWWV